MKAIITSLILGTSSLAVASPSSVHDHRYPGNHYQYDDRFDRDGRFDRDHWYRDGRGDRMRWRRPVLLAQNVQMYRQYNRDHRPLRIDLDPRIRGLQKLRLDRDSGRMFVDSVIVTFADGHRQAVRVNRMLSGRDPSLVIELDHGAVTGMYIYGTTMRARGATFDVIGLRR